MRLFTGIDLPDDVRSVLSAHEACTGTLLGGKSPGRPPALASSDRAASPRGRELDATVTQDEFGQ